MVIRIGEMIFQRYLDFAWSHMVLPAEVLAEILPHIRSHDFGILIEMVLRLANRLETQEVDWLAWEDPFILGQDADSLRLERSQSREETIKRLRGSLPFFQHFLTEAPELSQGFQWERKM